MKLTIILSIFGCQWLIAICLTRATALVYNNSDVPDDKAVSQIDTRTGDDQQQREIMTILDNSTKNTAEWNIDSNVEVKSTRTSISGYEATVSDTKLNTTDCPIVRIHDFSEKNASREDISTSAKMQITRGFFNSKYHYDTNCKNIQIIANGTNVTRNYNRPNSYEFRPLFEFRNMFFTFDYET